VKPIGRWFAVFIVCALTMTLACGSRTGAAGIPASPQTAQPPASPKPVVEEPSPPATTAADTRPDDCALQAQPGEPIATVGLTDRVDPSHAPHPSNDSERLVFRQLYETLVRVDCMGRVISGLASSWRLDDDGRAWIVTLREHAQFSDGTRVTPVDVRASWMRDGRGDELRPDVRRLIQSIEPVGDRSLAIRLQRQRVDVPLALAHSDLAIAKSVATSPWPLGTRSTRIAPESDTVPTTAPFAIAIAGDNLAAIRFLVAPGDPRDLLDRGVDLLLTRNPAALDYAGTLPQFQTVPLAWQRTHVLLTPGRSRSSPPLSDEQRQALAEDAVRGEARGARGPFWWQMVGDCEVASPSARRQASPTPRIVYDANDGAARDLAERFVGLARASGAAATAFLDVLVPDHARRKIDRASGLTGEPLALAKRLGSDAGYVISVDSRPLDACRDLQELMEGARWVDPETIVPLVETRLHAIVRRGRSSAMTEWDGGMVIADTHISR
jgi:Bacterial extracellular solute-binding proteins, family 5 Middle